MDSGLYAACAGLVARTAAVDTVANNLANVNTTAFRGRHSTFSSVLAKTGTTNLSTLNQDANDFGVLGGNRLDTTQGILQPTGNELDVAIEGPGYFPVQTATGTAYTRAGNFRVSPERQLITAQGDPVLGEGGAPITILGTPVSIASDGTISANGAVAGKLSVVDLPAGVDPQSVGASYLTVPAGTQVAPATESAIRQGSLEASNVNPISSVVELMNAQGEMESMRRALSLFSSEMDKTASQDLPRVS